MNNLLENYEPGKLEHKPKLLEQMKLMEEERNKRIEDHNKMLEYHQKMHPKSNSNSNSEIVLKYEKQLSDKTYLINELLKKLKILTIELDEYKKLNNK